MLGGVGYVLRHANVIIALAGRGGIAEFVEKERVKKLRPISSLYSVRDLQTQLGDKSLGLKYFPARLLDAVLGCQGSSKLLLET